MERIGGERMMEATIKEATAGEILDRWLIENGIALKKSEPLVYRSLVVMLADHRLVELDRDRLEEALTNALEEIQGLHKQMVNMTHSWYSKDQYHQVANDAAQWQRNYMEMKELYDELKRSRQVAPPAPVEEKSSNGGGNRRFGRFTDCEREVLTLIDANRDITILQLHRSLKGRNVQEIERAIKTLCQRGKIGETMADGVARYSVV